MKKLFTLLVLLVAIVTGAQAQSSYYTPTADEVIILKDVYNGNASSAGYSNHEAVAWGGTVSSTNSKKAGDPNNGGAATSSNVPCYSVKGNGGGKNITISVTGLSKIIVYHESHSSRYLDVRDGSKSGAVIGEGAASTYFTEIELDHTTNYSLFLHGRDSGTSDQDFYVYAVKLIKYVPAGPSITTQPADASYVTGGTNTPLSVVATASAGNLSYQWYSCDDADKTNAAAISGANNASYTPTAAGFYYVKVTDSNGFVDSDVAQVTFSSAEVPTISVSGAPAEAVKVGTEVILTATATGTPTPTVAWYDNADTTEPVATGATFTVPTTNAGTSVYYAVASNSEGNATSGLQTIIVKEQVAKPTITPNGAYFEEAQIVTLACTTDGATIQYSTNGGSTWENYDAEAGLKFYATTTLQAKATKEGLIDSEVATATFTKFTKSELASISGEKTWTIPTSLTLELTNTTFPAKYDDYYTYSDIALFNSNTLPATFDGTTLAFSGQYPYRGSNGAQNGNIQFITTVPGTVTIEFSNTGGSNKERWVKVNETIGTVEADGTTKRTETFEVSAGLVTITHVNAEGTLSAGIRFFKIEFTPVEADIILVENGNNATTIEAKAGATNQKVYVDRKLSNSYYNTIFLPFAMTAEQMTAAFGEGAQVATFVKMNSATEFGFGNVTAMEANVPYLVKPAQEVNGFTVEGVTISNTAAAGVVSGGYSMVGTYDTFTNGSSTSGGSIGISIGGSSSSSNEIYYFATTGKIKKLTSTGSIKGLRAFMVKLPAGKTSVETIVSNAGIKFDGGGSGPARARQDFVLNLDDDNTTTGIEAIENGQLTIDNDAPAYNLAGQKVGKGYKGLVIINGKKVVK